MQSQVISRQRVVDHGEVLTAQREVLAMLDLVVNETERIESRFLEPACGNGNFLAEVLRRKLKVVEKRYIKSQLEYERYAVLAVCSIYGIDILEDNVQECRKRLLDLFASVYQSHFADQIKPRCLSAVKYVLERNIIWGDAVTLKSVGEKPDYIVFSEWSPVNGSSLKRRDFSFRELVAHADNQGLPLFSDLGEEVFVATPEAQYPPIHFLELADAHEL